MECDRRDCPLSTALPVEGASLHGHLRSSCYKETQWRLWGHSIGGERSVSSSWSLHGVQQVQDCPASSGLGEEVRNWDLLGELRPKQRHNGSRGVTGGENGGEGRNIPGRGQTECVCIFEKQRLRKCKVGLVRRGWSP